MKTAEEAWDEAEHEMLTPQCYFKAGHNSAIEAMRQDCEPVAFVCGDHTENNNGYRFYGERICHECKPLYTHPQPLRELSREEVVELWDSVMVECVPETIERFAKLVWSAK